MRRFSIPISKPIKLFKRFVRFARLDSDFVLTVTSRSLKYARLKSWTVPDSLVSMVPAGSLCNLITRFASVRPSIASSNDSHEGA